ncbi:MAG: ubiquitin-conjugating enzyme E2 [Synechococcaceae cyanobacterium RL_1_2]|nr:ubiquitin-conjugating enzyme E2 [Synechococcaceae cyanobacterium RL_1_2]
MSVWQKRLGHDYQSLRQLLRQYPQTLTLIHSHDSPPHYYVLEFHCRGIEKLADDGLTPIFRDRHKLTISLSETYPRTKPYVKFTEPLFHPNVFTNGYVCLGDYWNMGESLAQLVIRLSKIIQYDPEVLGLVSPAHAEAKKWAEQNLDLFPLDRVMLQDKESIPLDLIWQE